MVVHVWAFLIAVGAVVIYRAFYLPPDELVFTAESTWGMIGFAFVPFALSIAGILAAMEARKLSVEEPWADVEV